MGNIPSMLVYFRAMNPKWSFCVLIHFVAATLSFNSLFLSRCWWPQFKPHTCGGWVCINKYVQIIKQPGSV